MGLFGSKKKEKFVVKVDGMTCNHCKMRVEKIASEYKGVSKAEVDLEAGKLTVEGKEGLKLEGLKKKITEAGYIA